MKHDYQIPVLNIRKLIIPLALLLCCALPSFAQNSCAGAQAITAGQHVIDVINGANTITNCSDESNAEWFSYTPTANYSVTVTSDLAVNVCKDTNFNVYTGTCNNLTCYVGDDDSGVLTCPQGGGSYLSKKTFDVIAGTTYYIAWDNRYQITGFTFQLIEAPYVSSPCTTATPVGPGLHTVAAITGTNINTNCSTASMANWYAYTPTQDYRVTISSDLQQNLCKDTNFSVYRGSCTGTLTCVANDDNSGILECNFGNTLSNLSKKTFDVTAGTTYYIVWDNKWTTAGFDFQISEEVIVVPVTYTAQTISTINNQYNICVADVNGDGLDDIVGVSTNTLKVHYQNNDGTFTITSYTVPGNSRLPSWGMAAGDYNRDGYLDFILGANGGLSFWQSNGGTGYTSITPGEYIFCQRLNFVDINNDGHLDVFACHDIDPNVYYLNDGMGGFTYYQSGITPGAYNLGIIMSGGNYASIWSDFDNDGDVDMFVSKCSGPPCELHRNDGDSFTDISIESNISVTPVQSWSSAIGDYDNDGDMDILVGSNGSTRSMLFRNNLNENGLGAFTNITTGSGWELENGMSQDYVAQDFDNDGFVDVFGVNGRILFNNGGNMTFSPTLYQGLSFGAIGDLNNDGFLDIQSGTTIRYAVPNGNKWIAVRLKGIQSNANGIGARVEIYGTWGKQIRDVRSGEGFRYMNTITAHFGIGSANAIEKIVIRWPSGMVDTIMNPSPNQKLMIVEGSTLSASDFADSNFTVYPNPTDDLLTVQMNNNTAGLKSMQVYDLNGRLVLNPVVSNNTLSIKGLASGTYLLLVKDNDGNQSTRKIIKR